MKRAAQTTLIAVAAAALGFVLGIVATGVALSSPPASAIEIGKVADSLGSDDSSRFLYADNIVGFRLSQLRTCAGDPGCTGARLKQVCDSLNELDYRAFVLARDSGDHEAANPFLKASTSCRMAMLYLYEGEGGDANMYIGEMIERLKAAYERVKTVDVPP